MYRLVIVICIAIAVVSVAAAKFLSPTVAEASYKDDLGTVGLLRYINQSREKDVGLLLAIFRQIAGPDRVLDEEDANARRKTNTPREFLNLDPSGDRRLTQDELERLAEHTFAVYDVDGDGVLSSSEKRRLDKVRQGLSQSSLFSLWLGKCDLPEPEMDARIIYVGGYQAGILSNVAIAGQDSVTETPEVIVQSGNYPLYIVAASHGPMIWRFSGHTERVSRFVVSANSNAGPKGVGATGLSRQRVTFIDQKGCIPGDWNLDTVKKMALKIALETTLKREVATVIGQNTLREKAGRSRAFDWFSADGHDEITFGHVAQRGDPGEMVSQFSPGGVAELDPTQVIASGKVERYAVLPEEAGLQQLMRNGLVKSRDGRYRIEAPIPRYPSGLNGAHSVIFVLAKGVPEPKGSPGHSAVYSEDRAEWIHK